MASLVVRSIATARGIYLKNVAQAASLSSRKLDRQTSRPTLNHQPPKIMFYQSPILISCREDGLIVATSVIEESVQAVAHTRSHAKKLLERRMRKLLECSCIRLDKFKSVVLDKRSFPAQPMHMQRRRRYPAGPTVTVPVRFVKIVDNWDKLFCILPDFGIHFYCPIEADFDAMLQETVRSMLASISPEKMVLCWPPNTTELDWLRVLRGSDC